jgi:hypothetical protein
LIQLQKPLSPEPDRAVGIIAESHAPVVSTLRSPVRPNHQLGQGEKHLFLRERVQVMYFFSCRE